MILGRFGVDRFVEFLPGIIIATVLIISLVSWQLLLIYSPRYYVGDPNFDVQEYKKQALENLRRQYDFQYRESIDESHVVLPPKVLLKQTTFTIGLIYLSGFVWGFSWSFYAYLNRRRFKSKWIVWISFGFYFLYQVIITLMLISAVMGKD